MNRVELWLVVLMFGFAASIHADVQGTASDVSSDRATLEKLLRDTPVLYNMDTQAIRDIFKQGQAVGNRDDVFTKIGDSNTTSGDFLQPLADSQHNCKLGSYDDLQSTINFFSASYDSGQSNSFTHSSVAAQNGLSSSAALDPMWADGVCKADESPVTCEYRLTKPSIAIIMLGLMDVRYQTAVDDYRNNLEQVIQASVDQGIIPVLTTLVVLPDQETLSYDLSLQFNAVMVDLSDTYQIPLINLWSAAQALPSLGIGPDRTHLKQKIGAFCDFTGAEQSVGGTLRNLLTLEALDAIRQNRSAT
jgi:hypothetical protein